MAHKIALINMKGGVGKSTLAVNLAWEMATAPWNKSVLIVDLDPQFNCSQYLVGTREVERIISEELPTVWDIMEQHTPAPGKPSAPLNPFNAVHRVYSPRDGGLLDFIPSRLELASSLRNPAGKEQLLKRAIDTLEKHYDIIVIDCAPTESFLTESAYIVSDYILVPVRPEYLSTIGLQLLEQSLKEFGRRHPGEALEVLGIVFNAVADYSPEERKSKDAVRQVVRDSGWRIFDAEVKYSRSFPTGAREGNPIFWTSYARTKAKANFHGFAREFAERIDL